jgi:acetyltransferase-like isoleucine patch superfamily enzyme
MSRTLPIKRLANGVFAVALSPAVMAFEAEQAFAGTERADAVFQAYSQALSLVPGLSGEFARRAFYEATLPRCGRDFTVGFGTVLSKRDVEVGDRVYVGMRCTLGHVVLEDHVTIGSNVDIPSGAAQHGFADLETPIQDQAGRFAKVRIGRNTWIGNGAIVLADVGARCVVGAGSVVTRPLPEAVVAAGAPARVVRDRREATGSLADADHAEARLDKP